MKLVIATNNKHKIDEINPLIPVDIEIVTLIEVGIDEDIPETGVTLVENALQKARFVYQKSGLSCFADDTGLEIDALEGRPGVYSARYAGSQCSAVDNVEKVLKELDGVQNRSARFRTVIALILDGAEYLFEGKVEGEMLSSVTGEGGFGYDPIFRPSSDERSFAQMPVFEKNLISHRAIATNKLVAFLKDFKEGLSVY